MNGIVAYGAYLPYFRLDRKAIGDVLGSGGGKGTRVVASYDEDTTSMGVEAARAALRGAPRLAPAAVYFATAEPAYLDKTNATAIHAALALDESAMAFDMLGSIRSAAGALRAAMDAGRPTLAVLADIRTGLPGGAAYGASKAALELLTKSWAAEYGPQGVNVNAIAPGPIRAPGTDAMGDGFQQIIATVAAGRGEPREIGAAAIFLASCDTDYIHGATLVVDGGMWRVRGCPDRSAVRLANTQRLLRPH